MREKLSWSVTFNAAFLWKQGKCSCASSAFNQVRKMMPWACSRAAPVGPRAPRPLRTLPGSWELPLVSEGQATSALCWQQRWAVCPQPLGRLSPAPGGLPVTSNSDFHLVRLLQYCVFKAPLWLVSRVPREIPFRTGKAWWTGGQLAELCASSPVSPAIERGRCLEPALEDFLSAGIATDPVSPGVLSCAHLLMILAEGLLLPSRKTPSSDTCQGEGWAGPRPKSVSDFSREKHWSQEDHLECSGWCWPLWFKGMRHCTKKTR